MRTTGYGSYRGRSPFKKFLKILLVIVLLLAILCAGAYIYLQRYVVITEDGVHLDIPFLEQDDPEPPPSAAFSDPPVDVVTPSPEPTPQPKPETVSPVALSAEALADGTALSQVETAGDCALFDMKTDLSDLNYVSSVQPIAGTDLNAQDETLNDSILDMNGTEGLYTVARVSCFKDAYIALYADDFPIRTNSGYCWTGPDELMWISPTSSAVRDYVTAICVELAQLGFDEILLDNAGYPSEGNLNYIKKGDAYDSARFSSVIGSFYTQVADALEEFDVTLSVVTTQAALDGLDELTGQTPENLALADRLWVRDEGGALVPLA